MSLSLCYSLNSDLSVNGNDVISKDAVLFLEINIMTSNSRGVGDSQEDGPHALFPSSNRRVPPSSQCSLKMNGESFMTSEQECTRRLSSVWEDATLFIAENDVDYCRPLGGSRVAAMVPCS